MARRAITLVWLVGGVRAFLPRLGSRAGRLGVVYGVSESEEESQTLAGLESEYWNSLSAVEQKILSKSRAGGLYLRLGQVEDALEAFDVARDLSGDSRYEWHRGVCLFYLERHEDAVADLVANAERYEDRFESPGTEERLFAVAAARRGSLTEEPPLVAEPQRRDSRPVFRALRELFAGEEASACEALRSLCRADGDDDKLRRRLYGHFYAALYFEARGPQGLAQAHMALAARAAEGDDDDLSAALPRIHAERRRWALDAVAEGDLQSAASFSCAQSSAPLSPQEVADRAPAALAERYVHERAQPRLLPGVQVEGRGAEVEGRGARAQEGRCRRMGHGMRRIPSEGEGWAAAEADDDR